MYIKVAYSRCTSICGKCRLLSIDRIILIWRHWLKRWERIWHHIRILSIYSKKMTFPVHLPPIESKQRYYTTLVISHVTIQAKMTMSDLQRYFLSGQILWIRYQYFCLFFKLFILICGISRKWLAARRNIYLNVLFYYMKLYQIFIF